MRFKLALLFALGCGSDDKLSVNNAVPVALITSHGTGDAVREGETVTFIGAVSDDTDEASTLSVTWLAGDLEACAAQAPMDDGTTTCDVLIGAGEELEIHLEVRDPKNTLGNDAVTLQITETDAPEVTLSAPTADESYIAGDLIEYVATVTDAEDAPEDLSLWFESNLDGRIDITVLPTSDGEIAGSITLSEGSHDLALWAEDTDGKTGRDRVVIEVVAEADNPPTAVILMPDEADDLIFYTDQLIEMLGEASDDEDAATDLLAEWESSLDGVLDVDATVESDGSITSYSELTEGEHILTLTVTDTAGQTDSDSVLVEVGPPNSGPECEITQPEDGTAVALDALVVFEATATDVDVPSDWLIASWSSDEDGDLGDSAPSSAGEVAFPIDTLSANTHTITLTVTDEVGYTCTDFILLTVSTPPELSVTSPADGETTNAGEAITFAATVTDAEDSAADLTVDWSSSLDGVLSSGAPDSSGTSTFISDSLSTGSHTLTITVTDTDGLYATAVQTLTINGAPTAPAVSISPEDPQTADTLSATITTASTDPDGDAITYTYAWLRDGVDTGETTSAVDPSLTAKDQTWTVVVTPTDGSAAGDAGSASVIIGNTAPELDSATVTPSAPSVTDMLTCTPGSATDADGDTVSLDYAWAVNGVDAGVSTTTLTGAFEAGDAVTCTVTPTDGDDEGMPVTSDAVEIDNAAPSIDAVTISPDPALAGETLSCSWTGYTDPDGDPDRSSAAWQINGVDAGTGTLLSSGFIGGDIVTCTVTPSDGTADGTAVSTSIVIDNTPPRITSVSISPSTASTGETLTCSYGGYSDVDGDADASSYRWSVDGLFAGYGATLSSGFSGGQTVTCEVTPYDGEDEGTALSASIVIDNSAPSISSVSIAPSSAATGETLTCSYTGYADADGDADASTYAWTIDGADAGSGSTLSSGFVGGDEVVCTVTPDDGTDTGTPLADSLTIDNTGPEVDSVEITADGPLQVGVTLTCAATASDADGESPDIRYAWTSGGSTLGTTDTLTVSASDASPGDAITCTATATDGDGATDSDSDAVTLDNTAPVVDSVTITPASGVTISSTLSCAATASDEDGDSPTLSYAWDADGTSLGSGSTLDISASGATKGQAITCTATATDSDGGTDTGTDSVTVGNTAPQVLSAAITPSSAQTNDTLSVLVTTSDDDDDTVSLTYLWYVGSSTAGTGSTLDGTSAFDKGETVYVVVTPTDGEDEGDALATASITIENTPPTAPEVSIATYTAPASLLFDGTDDYVEIPTSGDFNLGAGDWTIEAWARWRERDDQMWILTWRDAYADDGCAPHHCHMQFGYNHLTNNLGLYWRQDPGDGVSFPVEADHELVVGEWFHFAAVRNGSTLTLYINGEYKNDRSISGGMRTLDDSMYIGASVRNAAAGLREFWNGYIGPVRFSSTARYTSDFTPTADWSSDSSTVALWPMNAGSGSVMEDHADDHDGTISGATWSSLAPDGSSRDILTCAIDTDSTDADGDTIDYTFSWDVDGTAYTDTETTTDDGDTVSADALGYDETWTCTVTPNDGEEDGESAEAEHITDSLSTEIVAHHGGTLIRVSAQTYRRGCDPGPTPPPCSDGHATPSHEVTLTNDFFIGETEITQDQYESVIGFNPSWFDTCGGTCPVEDLTWHEALAFANAVSTAEGLENCYTCSSGFCTQAVNPYECEGYRLPTEAEWEAAARCGEDYWYPGSDTSTEVASYMPASGERPQAVGSLSPNACGLYDMGGNVWEFTQDSLVGYSSASLVDPTGEPYTDTKARRGGGWDSSERQVQVSSRSDRDHYNRNPAVGLRLARTAD